jgi:DNA-binding CsgD family transcriptional regulator
LSRTAALARQGRFAAAEALAHPLMRILPQSDPNVSWLYYLLAHIAHLRSHYAEAIQLSRQAKSCATSQEEKALAAWTEFIASAELETDDLLERLIEFKRVAPTEADYELRVASGTQIAREHLGTFAGVREVLESALPLTDYASDPLAISNILASCSYINVAAARYSQGLAFAERAIAFCTSMKLDFALAYCLVYRGYALLGLRRFNDARASQEVARRLVAGSEDPHLALEHALLESKLQLATSEHHGIDWVNRSNTFRLELSPKSPYGRILALGGLAAAATGRLDEARREARRAMSVTPSPEAQVLGRFGLAIAALRGGRSREGHVGVSTALLDAKRRQCLDCVVTAYRAYPAMLLAVEPASPASIVVEDAICAANDHELARRIGLKIQRPRILGEVKGLTAREREVMSLLSDGCTHAEIASKLFISVSTAKVHTHHIRQKLGARTRLDAVLRWRELCTADRVPA